MLTSWGTPHLPHSWYWPCHLDHSVSVTSLSLMAMMVECLLQILAIIDSESYQFCVRTMYYKYSGSVARQPFRS